MSDPILTICIPIGPGHEAIAERAKDSVRQQTVPVRGDAFYDRDGRGAGFARNQLLARVQTPYVAFLDADDYLLPNFAERMLLYQAQIEPQGKYGYSGFNVPEWDDNDQPTGRILEAFPAGECYCPETNYSVHLITALIPTTWARAVGGFDETLIGSEDTDFFMKLHLAGHCGALLSEVLLFWDINGENRRGRRFHFNPDKARIMGEILGRYPKENMSCCGGNPVLPNGPAGERQNGDIQAQVLGPAFIVYVGRGTGRLYENVGYGQIVWASPLDVDADPMRFRRYVPNPAPMPTQVATTAADIAAFMENQPKPTPQAPPVKRVNGKEIARMAGFEDE
jgi:glycosyltransferase involved in cell wall biosynthesis